MCMFICVQIYTFATIAATVAVGAIAANATIAATAAIGAIATIAAIAPIAAITSIALVPYTGTLWQQYSTATLYGIKNSQEIK